MLLISCSSLDNLEVFNYVWYCSIECNAACVRMYLSLLDVWGWYHSLLGCEHQLTWSGFAGDQVQVSLIAHCSPLGPDADCNEVYGISTNVASIGHMPDMLCEVHD
jgi:hypothetical protein